MADPVTPNGVPAGGVGTFNAVLQDNGTPVANFAGPWSFGTNDPSAVVTTVTSDATGATVTVSIPASDQSQSFILTASTQAPDGSGPVTGSLTVQIPAGVNNFTVVITQTA